LLILIKAVERASHQSAAQVSHEGRMLRNSILMIVGFAVVAIALIAAHFIPPP
jgi:hypothetical protein